MPQHEVLMSFIEEVKKLEGLDVSLYLGAFLATVAPGFLLLLLYRPGLIEALDTVKLIILSASIGLPLFTLNAFIAIIFTKKGEAPDFHEAGLESGIITSIAFYVALLAAYYTAVSLKLFIPMLALINFIFYISILVVTKDKVAVEA